MKFTIRGIFIKVSFFCGSKNGVHFKNSDFLYLIKINNLLLNKFKKNYIFIVNLLNFNIFINIFFVYKMRYLKINTNFSL